MAKTKTTFFVRIAERNSQNGKANVLPVKSGIPLPKK